MNRKQSPHHWNNSQSKSQLNTQKSLLEKVSPKSRWVSSLLLWTQQFKGVWDRLPWSRIFGVIPTRRKTGSRRMEHIQGSRQRSGNMRSTPRLGWTDISSSFGAASASRETTDVSTGGAVSRCCFLSRTGLLDSTAHPRHRASHSTTVFIPSLLPLPLSVQPNIPSQHRAYWRGLLLPWLHPSITGRHVKDSSGRLERPLPSLLFCVYNLPLFIPNWGFLCVGRCTILPDTLP